MTCIKLITRVVYYLLCSNLINYECVEKVFRVWICLSESNHGFYIITAYSLRCYECDNKNNPACGVYFKSYQFQAPSCGSINVKCGLQRQLPDAGMEYFRVNLDLGLN